MGGEVPFILRNCPDFIIQKAYRFSGLYNPKRYVGNLHRAREKAWEK